jgi:uncharacterized protein
VTGAEWALLVAGAAVAGFVQGLTGFGFSMVAMSIWVWGLSPQLAAVLAVFGSLTGQIVGWFSLRRALDLRTLLPFLLGGLAGIPIGAWLLPLLDADLFKLALGVLLVVVCPARPRAAQPMHCRAWAAASWAGWAASPVSSRRCGARCAAWPKSRSAR